MAILQSPFHISRSDFFCPNSHSLFFPTKPTPYKSRRLPSVITSSNKPRNDILDIDKREFLERYGLNPDEFLSKPSSKIKRRDRGNTGFKKDTPPEEPKPPRETHKLLQVLGGTARRKKLLSPKGMDVRPMMEVVKASAFAILQAAGGSPQSLRPGRWLDLYSGTGSVGIEAISRGCSKVHFVEMDPWVVSDVLRPNLESTDFLDVSVIHTARVETFLENAQRFVGKDGVFDYISVTPPYMLVDYAVLMEQVSNSSVVGENTFMVVEYPLRTDMLDSYAGLVKLIGGLAERILRYMDQSGPKRRVNRKHDDHCLCKCTRLATYELAILDHLTLSAGNDGIIGFTCDSSRLLTGATFTNNMDSVFPQTAWLVSNFGVLTAGVQYEPKFGSKGRSALPNNMENWSWAISYGLDVGSPVTPSFNFGLQLVNNSQFIVSFYRHMRFQRRVINPFEKKAAVLITNYLDIGIEMQARMTEYKDKIRDSTIQVAASWQANKNFLLKGKMGPLSSSIALFFKSWWEPAVTFNISAIRDHIKGDTSFGLGFQVGSKPLRRYQMVSSEYARMHSKDTPNREHPVGILKWNTD